MHEALGPLAKAAEAAGVDGAIVGDVCRHAFLASAPVEDLFQLAPFNNRIRFVYDRGRVSKEAILEALYEHVPFADTFTWEVHRVDDLSAYLATLSKIGAVPDDALWLRLSGAWTIGDPSGVADDYGKRRVPIRSEVLTRLDQRGRVYAALVYLQHVFEAQASFKLTESELLEPLELALLAEAIADREGRDPEQSGFEPDPGEFASAIYRVVTSAPTSTLLERGLKSSGVLDVIQRLQDGELQSFVLSLISGRRRGTVLIAIDDGMVTKSALQPVSEGWQTWPRAALEFERLLRINMSDSKESGLAQLEHTQVLLASPFLPVHEQTSSRPANDQLSMHVDLAIPMTPRVASAVGDWDEKSLATVAVLCGVYEGAEDALLSHPSLIFSLPTVAWYRGAQKTTSSAIFMRLTVDELFRNAASLLAAVGLAGEPALRLFVVAPMGEGDPPKLSDARTVAVIPADALAVPERV